MCGIFGSPNITPSVQRMLPFLGIAMQTRGRDAWGASNGDEILKFVGELTDTWGEASLQVENWKAGIFHTRGASHGSAKVLANAHPFEYRRADGDRIIGIHNGVISNHNELDRKYQRHCAVDSMHLWMSRAEGKAWDDMEGWGNLAWWETDDRGRRLINLARFNTDALHVVKLQGGEMLFASEIQPLRMIAKMHNNPVVGQYVLDEYYHYWLAPKANGEMTIWRSENRLPFPVPYSSALENYGLGISAAVTGPQWQESRNTSRALPLNPTLKGDLDGWCAKCGNTRLNSKESLMCMSCTSELIGDFLRWKNISNRIHIVPTAGVGNVN